MMRQINDVILPKSANKNRILVLESAESDEKPNYAWYTQRRI